MEQDTPALDRRARTLAEAVHAGYMRQAEGPTHPQAEQTLLARLAEAIRPELPGGTAQDLVAAANRALDAWERSGPARGPRVGALDPAAGSATMAAAP